MKTIFTLITIAAFFFASCTRDALYSSKNPGKKLLDFQSNVQQADYINLNEGIELHLTGVDNSTTTAAAYDGVDKITGTIATAAVTAFIGGKVASTTTQVAAASLPSLVSTFRPGKKLPATPVPVSVSGQKLKLKLKSTPVPRPARAGHQ